MNILIPHIEYLLQSHDCVIVPGIGAVLAHGVSAYYADEEGVWHSPKRVFSFNAELNRTDGLLASSVARREGISMDAAARSVNAAVDEMRAELEQSRSLSLGACGSLHMDAEGFMSFVPGDCAWLSPMTLWLPAFEMYPVTRASEMERVASSAIRRSLWPGRLMRAAQVAACAGLIFILGWVVMKNLTYNPAPQFATVGPVEALRPETVTRSQAPATLILATAPADEVIENRVVKPQRADAAYFLVIASLASDAEAQKFISQYPDINLGILEKDGRYRIYAASGASVAETNEAFSASGLASRFPTSWVCRR